MLNYLVENARIVDPAHDRVFEGSVGIAGGRIVGIYAPGQALPHASERIDVHGNLLLPGFIDIHAHTDNDIPTAEKLLAQGVTTVLAGNCGFSPEDLPSFFAECENGYPVNQAIQVGHDTLRNAVGLTDIFEAATDEQISQMGFLAQEAFKQGAWGLSFGLEYDPGASAEEVRALARVAADAGRIVSIHTRCEGGREIEGLEEALDLALEIGARVQISHLVYMYTKDLLPQAIETIARYKDLGLDIGVDSGVYTAWQTYAYSPSFSPEGLANNGVSYEDLVIASGPHAGEHGTPALVNWLREHDDHAGIICDPGAPGDVEKALLVEGTMLSTDCGKADPGEGHPQAAATYPLFFRRFVFDRELLSLPEAARRTSYLPARALGLLSKGTIEVGADADLVVIDPERYDSEADFPGSGSPDLAPTGVSHVFVGGRLAVSQDGPLPGVFAGGPLIHAAE